jgi:hypothetical protein
MRILLILLFSLAVLTGCSNTWNAINETWKQSGSGERDARITNDYIRQLPYASLLLAIEPRAEALLVLESVEGKRLNWRANNGALISIEGGRVISLSVDASNYRVNNNTNSVDPVRSNDWRDHQSYNLTLDFPHLQLYQQLFHCQLQATSTTAFKTPLRSGTAIVYQEQCQLSHGRYRAQNEYWVDAQGRVVKARQHFHPTLPGAVVFNEAKPTGWQAE